MTHSLTSLIASRSGDAGSDVFLEDARSERVITYGQLATSSLAWRGLLDELEVPDYGAVLLSYRDPLSFAVAHLSIIAAGRRSIPLAPDVSENELRRSSDLIGGAWLVVSDREVSPAVDGAATASVDRETGGPSSVVAVSMARRNPSPTDDEERTDATGGAAVLFTSGSTGTPKGVELLESQLLFVAGGIAENNQLTSSDRGFNSLPLFHVNAQVVGLLSTLVVGATLVLDDAFHRTGFWELLAERRITWLNAVPAVLAVLTREGSIPEMPALRFIRSASAPLPDAVRSAIGAVPLVLSWGMTEGASQITATPLGEPLREGSVGVPIGNEVTARDDAGETLPPGETGELWIRGDGVVHSYLFGRAAERFTEGGWLHTGDLGWLDEDGWVYLIGRSDDVINRGGEKVYPAEVEEVLLEDDRVREAVVVAKPDAILGQVPAAYVIVPADRQFDQQQLISDLTERCTRELPRFKRPTTISVVTDLPRAPTGKVQRAKVRELAADGGRG